MHERVVRGHVRTVDDANGVRSARNAIALLHRRFGADSLVRTTLVGQETMEMPLLPD